MPDPIDPPAAEESASIFNGLTVNKEGLTKTVTGEELHQVAKPDDKPPITPKPDEKPPVPSTPPKAGAVPLEAREKGPSHQKFAEVTAAREKAQKELETARKEWEAKQADYEARLAKGTVPEEHARQLADALATKAKLENDLRGLIVDRAARQELEPRKVQALAKIGIIGAARGDQAMIAAAKAGNYEALAEIVEIGDLTPLQKRDVDRLLNEARGYDDQLSQRISDPEAAWKELEARNKAQMEQARQAQLVSNLDLAKQTHTALINSVPALADAPEISKEVRARLEAIAGGPGNERYTAKHMMQVVAEHTIFETLCKNQQAKILKLEADLKEKVATINRQKAPNFRPSHVEPELEEETVGTGLFSSGLVVNTGR
jgi:hypothetical protein